MAKKKAKSTVVPQERPPGKRGRWSKAELAAENLKKAGASSSSSKGAKAAAPAPPRNAPRRPATEDRIAAVEGRQKNFYAREPDLNANGRVVLHGYFTPEGRDRDIARNHPDWVVLKGEEVRALSHVGRGEQPPEYIWENDPPEEIEVQTGTSATGSVWNGFSQSELTFVANTTADRIIDWMTKKLPAKLSQPIIDGLRSSVIDELKNGKKDPHAAPAAAGPTSNLPVAQPVGTPPGQNIQGNPPAAPNVDRQSGAH